MGCNSLDLKVDVLGSKWVIDVNPLPESKRVKQTNSELAQKIRKGKYNLGATEQAEIKNLFDNDVKITDRIDIGGTLYRPVGKLENYCRNIENRCISRRDVLEAQRDAMYECLTNDYDAKGDCQNVLENMYVSLDQSLKDEDAKEGRILVGLAVLTLAMTTVSASAHFASTDVRSLSTWTTWRSWFLVITLVLKMVKLRFSRQHGDTLVVEWEKIDDPSKLLGTEKKFPDGFNLTLVQGTDKYFKNTNNTKIPGIRDTHFVNLGGTNYKPYRPEGNRISALISGAVLLNASVALYDTVFHTETKVFLLRPEEKHTEPTSPPVTTPEKPRTTRMKRLRQVREGLYVGCPLLALFFCTVLYARGDKYAMQGYPRLEGGIRLLSNNYVVGLVCLLMWSASVGLGSIEEGIPRIDTLQIRIGLLTLALVDLGTSLHVMNTYKCRSSRVSGLFDL